MAKKNPAISPNLDRCLSRHGPVQRKINPTSSLRLHGKVVYDFHQSGLVEVVPVSTQAVPDVVPVGLFDRLISELTDAMGPMASVIVHD